MTLILRMVLLTCLAMMPALDFARAQIILPPENSYRVFRERDVELPALIPVTFKDQFGVLNVDLIQRFSFAAPTSIDGSVVPDAGAYQTLFAISSDSARVREVTVTDRFGTFTWQLQYAAYFFTPARKNPAPGDRPPSRNHYVCYLAILGPSVDRMVTISDEFSEEQVTVRQGKLFCNPAQKTTEDGSVYPIVDPESHLACYVVEDPTPDGTIVITLDQFGESEMRLTTADCLCVPALKREATSAESSTWGRIKRLYRR